MRKTYNPVRNPYFTEFSEFEEMARSIDNDPNHTYSKEDIEETLYGIEHIYYNYGSNMELATVKNLLSVHSDLERLYNN